jgi:hypothetical protein
MIRLDLDYNVLVVLEVEDVVVNSYDEVSGHINLTVDAQSFDYPLIMGGLNEVEELVGRKCRLSPQGLLYSATHNPFPVSVT